MRALFATLLVFGLQSTLCAQDVAPVTTYAVCKKQVLTFEIKNQDEHGDLVLVHNIVTVSSITSNTVQMSVAVTQKSKNKTEDMGTVLLPFKVEPDFVKVNRLDKLSNVKITNKVYTVSKKRIPCTVISVSRGDGSVREIWVATKGKDTTFPGIVLLQEKTEDDTFVKIRLTAIKDPKSKAKEF